MAARRTSDSVMLPVSRLTILPTIELVHQCVLGADMGLTPPAVSKRLAAIAAIDVVLETA